MRRKLLYGAVAATILAGGFALAQTVKPLVSSLNSTDYIQVQQTTGPGFQWATLTTLADFVRTSGTSIATVALGGTGRATLTANSPLIGNGTTAVALPTAGTTGQLFQGATSAAPAFSTALSGAYVFSNALVTFGNSAGTPTHIATAQTTAPALTSCGTGSPAITGTDEAGIVTLGTNATGCVITFNVAYTGTPYCVVSWIATPLASQSYVTSNASITLTQTSASGNKAQYICRATAGG